jgi:hypothetical protein
MANPPVLRSHSAGFTALYYSPITYGDIATHRRAKHGDQSPSFARLSYPKVATFPLYYGRENPHLEKQPASPL